MILFFIATPELLMRNLLYDSARISYRNRVGRNIFRYDGARTDYRTLAYRNAGQNRYVRTEPGLCTDRYGLIAKYAFHPLVCINSMIRANNVTVRTDERTMSYCDNIAIKKGTIKVYNARSLKVDILSEYALKTVLDEYVFVVARNELFG